MDFNFQIKEKGKAWNLTPSKIIDFESHGEARKFTCNVSFLTGKEIRFTEGLSKSNGICIKINHK